MSVGYGTVFAIKGDEMQANEITSISCVPTWVADRVTGDTGVVFRRQQSPARFSIYRSASPDTLRLHSYGAASSILLYRVRAGPATCAQPTPSDPVTIFEVFWNTYAEQYGFFDLRGIDWGAVHRRFAPQVTARMTPRALFEVLQAMIEPLHDAHTYLGARDIDGRYHGSRPDSNALSDEDRDRVGQIIQTRYLIDPIHLFCNDRIGFGMLNHGIGYLRISGFSAYTADRDYERGTAALEAALDTIFQNSARLRGLVIDVRLNGGGNDPWGVAVASRLTGHPYLAFAKEARADIHDPSQWTAPEETWTRAAGRPGFLGAVVELTGINSVSAAETFTMALMGRSPHVTRVGENTQGVFSDILGRPLPNGWIFGLPNERFLTADGKAFDGPGVPPEVPVPVFPRSDLQAGRDGALERALQILDTAAHIPTHQ